MRKRFFVISLIFACIAGVSAQTTVIANGSSKKLGNIDFKELESMYEAAVGDEIDLDIPALAFYSVFDLDHDGLDEVWVMDGKKEYGALFCFGSGKAEVIDVCHEIKSMSVMANAAVSAGGSCGTGCVYRNFRKIANSRVTDRLDMLTLVNIDTNKAEDSYTKNDVEISEESGKAMVKSFGGEAAIKHHWRKIPQK